MNNTQERVEEALLDTLWLANACLLNLMFSLLVQIHATFASTVDSHSDGKAKGVPLPQVAVCEVQLPDHLTAASNTRVLAIAEVNGQFYAGPFDDLLTTASQTIRCDDWDLKIAAADVRDAGSPLNVSTNPMAPVTPPVICRRIRLEVRPLDGDEELPLNVRLHLRVDQQVPAQAAAAMNTAQSKIAQECDSEFPPLLDMKSNNTSEFRSRCAVLPAGKTANASMLLLWGIGSDQAAVFLRALADSAPDKATKQEEPLPPPDPMAAGNAWFTAFLRVAMTITPSPDPDTQPQPTLRIEVRPTATPPAQLQSAAPTVPTAP